MRTELAEEFSNPGSQYRGAPFWAWNGRLEPEELRRQIRIMKQMGLGGFFMHSRVGLDTAYLSDEWFECVKACIDEAEKLDMQAWLYDEDRWPSGAAGGLVTKNPRYRMREIILHQFKSAKDFRWTKNTLAAFTAKIDGRKASGIKRVPRNKKPSKPAKGEIVIAFTEEMHKPSSWYNGCTYLDTMNHEAVKEFIKVTHEAYRKNIGRHFGKRVPGIFTDEPNYGNVSNIPWTPKLPQVFRRRYGYDLLDHLLELQFDVVGKKISKARYNYRDCITFLFVDAFARQIGQWCEKNKIQHTGHVQLEDDLSQQTVAVGDAMRFYEYMQAPGMDLLTEHWRVYDTAKQVSSVARQFGRKWRLTETYGCTGWDFPFAGHKALGDWQAALGINLRCQHLSWYTMQGEAKRDYPASISYQSPWWKDYSKVENYFARINLVMTRGKEVRDVLVIHPIESGWLFNHKDNAGAGRYNQMLIDLRESLLRENIDFDYGDEEILSRHAGIKTGKDPVIRVGQAVYKAVIVPSLLTIRSSTVKLLERFQKAGGHVVFAGNVPEFVDAESSDRAVKLARNCSKAPARGKKLPAAVEDAGRRISIRNADGKEIAPALYLLREDRDAFYLFVVNSGHSTKQMNNPQKEDVMVRDRKESFPSVEISGFIGCEGSPVELDPDSGKIFSANAAKGKKGWKIKTSLPALGSRLFLIPKKQSSKKYEGRKEYKTVKSSNLKAGKWDILLSENNVIVLDMPRYRIGNGRWRKVDEILRVDRSVRNSLGIPHRSGPMVQPWARKKVLRPKKTLVDLEYSFEMKTLPEGELYLALERPETFHIQVNGNQVSMDAECGWWCDMSLRKIPIDTSLLVIGNNSIQLRCNYDENHSGLEIAYLLGNFGVKLSGRKVTVTGKPTGLKIGDWTKQGLPFYSGSVSYCTEIRPKLKKNERLFLRIPEYRGVAVRIIVNGQSAGIIAWEPNEVDITDMLHPAGNELRVEVIGHRRNSHGALHLSEKWPEWAGPETYVTTGESRVDYYQLVPCGLMKEPKLLIKDEVKS